MSVAKVASCLSSRVMRDDLIMRETPMCNFYKCVRRDRALTHVPPSLASVKKTFSDKPSARACVLKQAKDDPYSAGQM
jgi:hypothetical protein